MGTLATAIVVTAFVGCSLAAPTPDLQATVNAAVAKALAEQAKPAPTTKQPPKPEPIQSPTPTLKPALTPLTGNP